MLLLERLSDARRHGRPVLAVVRGSAVNQDGATNGLTAPNGLAQQRVIRAALTNARVSAAEVDVLEAHGTGTVLGDPIEAEALLEAYGQDRPADRPLLVGSVKSNIGHTWAAAGVVGVIKMVEAIRRGVIPKTLHVDEPTPRVDWSSGAVRLVTEPQRWPRDGRPRRAAVSSFGISGTNAHVILEQVPEPDPELTRADTRLGDTAVAWVVSARNAAALRGLAARLRSSAAVINADLSDVGFSLATTRAQFDHRAVLIAQSRTEFADTLTALAEDARSPAIVRGHAAVQGRLAVLLPGQGSQHVGMGQQLYLEYPVFAKAVDEMCAHFDPHLDRPLREVVFGDSTGPLGALDRTEYTQPALFTIEVATFRLLESWGIRPNYLLGHSIGELAAAHIAGVLSSIDAATVVAARGRLMQRSREGTMLSIRATADEVAVSLTGHESEVAIAASNGPNATVIAGDDDVVQSLGEHWRKKGRRVKMLSSDRAFHSPHMDCILAEFRAVLASVQLSSATIPVVSSVTGELATDGELRSPDYWVRQARDTVRFQDSLRFARRANVRTFLEVGPGDVLGGMSLECLDDPTCAVVPTLPPGRPEVLSLVRAAATLWVRRVPVDWASAYGANARTIDLPTYAFQKQRYWPASRPTVPGLQTVPAKDAVPDPAQVEGTGLSEYIATMPEAEQLSFLTRSVRQQICEILLDRSADGIRPDDNIIEIGLTSLSTLELRSRIGSVAGVRLSIESILGNPTPEAIARLVLSELTGHAHDE